METGERIRQLRTQRNMPQQALADSLGVTRQAVAKWESGASRPSAANLAALCRLFGVSWQQLAGPGGAPAAGRPARPPSVRRAGAAGRRTGGAVRRGLAVGARPGPAVRRHRLCRRAGKAVCGGHTGLAVCAAGSGGPCGPGGRRSLFCI